MLTLRNEIGNAGKMESGNRLKLISDIWIVFKVRSDIIDRVSVTLPSGTGRFLVGPRTRGFLGLFCVLGQQRFKSNKVLKGY